MALSVYLCYLLLWQQRNRIYLDLSKLNVSLVHFPLGLRSFQKLKDLKYSEFYLSVLKLLQPQLTHLRVKSQQSLWISTILSLQQFTTSRTYQRNSHNTTQLMQPFLHVGTSPHPQTFYYSTNLEPGGRQPLCERLCLQGFSQPGSAVRAYTAPPRYLFSCPTPSCLFSSFRHLSHRRVGF